MIEAHQSQNSTLENTPAFSRAWAWPDSNTTASAPIADFVRRHAEGKTVIVDPFARNSQWASIYSNDINPHAMTRFHMHAWLFLWMLARRGVRADLVIFDPPFSPTQVKRAYENFGLIVTRRDTQTARLKKVCRWLIRRLSGPGTKVLSFGWNTAGMGEGWITDEILIVDHGGDHNATICMAQHLPNQPQILNLGSNAPGTP